MHESAITFGIEVEDEDRLSAVEKELMKGKGDVGLLLLSLLLFVARMATEKPGHKSWALQGIHERLVLE